jgi:hypothetical protein
VSGCSRWNFTGGLPETSNCYCHPGTAGGSPAYARNAFPSSALPCVPYAPLSPRKDAQGMEMVYAGWALKSQV